MVEFSQYVTQWGNNEKDTGSCAVQIAHMTDQIKHLTQHLMQHKKDFSTRLGLIKLAARRRSLLNYMKKKNFDDYTQLIQALGLKK